MKLPNLPFFNKKKSDDYLVSLIFKPKNIIATLLKNTNEKIDIVSTKSVSLNLSSANTEEMTAACDEAISSIELSLNENENVERTIFSVPHYWAEDDSSIKKERLLQLKKLSVELALKPMGFIISIEAIIKHLQDKDGVPLSAILVEEAQDRVYLYLIKRGNILEIQSGVIDGMIEHAIEKTLKKVENFEKLPTKMILLHHNDIASRQQELLSYQWSSDLPFLHLPQISILEKGFENEAIVDAIASQLHIGVGDSKVEGNEIIENDASSVDEKESFGFVKEEDIIEREGEYAHEVREQVLHGGEEREDKKEDEEKKSIESTTGILAFISSFPESIMGFLKIPTKPSSKLKTFLIPILAVLIFIALTGLYYILFLKAEVVVFLAGDELSDEVIVSLSEDDTTSFESKILHINTIEQEVSGSVVANATGTEEVGDEATGEVTILSSVDNDTIIEAGTVLTSSNGLKFSLDDDVEIASSSGVSDIKRVRVGVTAEEFGKEYNLPSATKFSVAGFSNSSIEAENETAFAGGSKEEKTIVAERDVLGLEEKVLSELFDQAVSNARERLGDDEEIISVLLDASIEEENYSASVGDEAKSVKLEATVLYTLGVYRKEEAKKFIDDARGEDFPEGLEISEEDSDIRLIEIEEDEGEITGTLSYEVLYKPDVQLDNLAEQISGKSVDSAIELIEQQEVISDVTIILPNKLPLLPSILPLRSSQIEITLESE